VAAADAVDRQARPGACLTAARMASDIFISYAREDEPTAIHLRDVLVAQGWDVWRDKEGILTGTSWEKAIEDSLNAAKCVIVLWSRAALTSHFVRDEASVARNANKLVPVQIENLDIPLGFRGIQTANLVGWKGSTEDPEFRKLIRALSERVGAQPAPAPVVVPVPARVVRKPLSGGAGIDLARAKAWLGSPVALLSLAALVLLGGGYLVGRQQAHGTESESAHEALEQGLRLMLDSKYADAEPMLERAMSAGSGGAGYYLSRMYRDGLGVTKDDAKALAFAQRGAFRGNALAENLLGNLLSAGRGAAQDDAQALGWYFRAADHGNPWGALNAGYMLENGRGAKSPDITRAISYYQRAIDDNIAPAGNALGNLYRNGKGVPQDVNRAFQWYKWAADRGDANAQISLGFMYANGQGAPRDDARAFELYRRAADQNSAVGINNVGYFYEFGRFVPMNLNEAASWYQRAVQLGDKTAPGNLGRVQEKLRSAQSGRH
jgi:TPR repeat protein